MLFSVKNNLMETSIQPFLTEEFGQGSLLQRSYNFWRSSS